MTYRNRPVSDGYQVVQQIASFASETGWTIHRSGEQTSLNGSTLYYEVTLSAPGYPCYLTLAGYPGTGGVYLNGHRSYDDTKRWWEQPDQFHNYVDDGDGGFDNDGSELQTTCLAEIRVTPILSVHMFCNMTPTPYMYAVIEKEPGYYRHMVFGHLEKFGTSLGGMFWDVSARERWNSYQTFREYHRPPFSAPTTYYITDYKHRGGVDTQDETGAAKFGVFGDSIPAGYLMCGHWPNEWRTFLAASPIQFNSRTPLLTPTITLDADTYRPLGTPPAVRYINLEYYEPGDEITIGTDVWKVFPVARQIPGVRVKDDNTYAGTEYEATGNYGIAYLKG